MPPPPGRARRPGPAQLRARPERSRRDGRRGEAILRLRQAACLAPSDAAIRHDLGVLTLQAGHYAEAVASFEQALVADPSFALASLRLGVALQALGDEEAAIDAYQHASALQPSLVEARFRAGALLETHGRRAEAAAAFRRVANARPKTSLTRLAKARLLLAEGDDAAAERVLRQLLALTPDDVAATDLLGMVLADAGRLAEAADCYDRATRASPHYAGSYYDLVRCRRVSRDDADLVERMRAALACPGLHPETRLKLHLALGKASDDVGDPAGAMRHFDAADALRGTLCRFDLSALQARVDRLIARFTPDLLRPPGPSYAGEVGGPAPVFIVGLPRSGTTLVEQILSCHPFVEAGGELPFWTERGAHSEQDGAAGLEPGFLAAAASDYTRLLHALAPDSGHVTDKMPLNVFWAGLIHLCLPHATIIHCRRRAIDVALSIHRTYFNQHVAFPTGGSDLVAAVRAVERLTSHWRAVLPEHRFIELDYEELVDEPEPAIRRLVAACALQWDDACLRPERNSRIVRTPSKWQVRQPISRAPVDAWRRYEPWLGTLSALLPDATGIAVVQHE